MSEGQPKTQVITRPSAAAGADPFARALRGVDSLTASNVRLALRTLDFQAGLPHVDTTPYASSLAKAEYFLDQTGKIVDPTGRDTKALVSAEDSGVSVAGQGVDLVKWAKRLGVPVLVLTGALAGCSTDSHDTTINVNGAPQNLPYVTPLTPDATPSASPSTGGAQPYEHELKHGETVTVPADVFCGGDVQVDGVAYYGPGNFGGTRGNIVILPKGGSVYAPFSGADCKTLTIDDLSSFIREMKGDEVKNGISGGCGNAADGCDDVAIWRQRGTTVRDVNSNDADVPFEHELGHGETITVPAGSICLGDVRMGKDQFFDGQNNGHILEVRDGGSVTAPFSGADCKTEQNPGGNLGASVLQMMNHGGTNNAGVDKVVVYKQGKPQK